MPCAGKGVKAKDDIVDVVINRATHAAMMKRLLSLVAAFAVSWPLSDHTETIVVVTPQFSLFEFVGWFAAVFLLGIAPAFLLGLAPSSSLGRFAYMAVGVIVAALFTHHTDTEIIEETTHDWAEHAKLTAGIFCAINICLFAGGSLAKGKGKAG